MLISALCLQVSARLLRILWLLITVQYKVWNCKERERERERERGGAFLLYRVIQNDCRGFNNLSYTIHLRQQYVVAPMDQEILKVFFYDVRCAVVMHFSAWSTVY